MNDFLVLFLIAAGFILLGTAAFGIGPLAPLAGPIHQVIMTVLGGG